MEYFCNPKLDLGTRFEWICFKFVQRKYDANLCKLGINLSKGGKCRFCITFTPGCK